MIWNQTLVCVTDVPASSAWYCAVLGGVSGHGGDEYEQIVVDGEVGYVSGLCVSEEWEGDAAKRLEPWRDAGASRGSQRRRVPARRARRRGGSGS